MENNPNICSVCHQPVLPQYYFCPNCGNNLKGKPVKISTMNQVALYALAIFLPPFGFAPGIKHMLNKSPQAKRVGLITTILTLCSTIAIIWGIFALFGNYINEMRTVLNASGL